MTDLLFYHLERARVEDVLPPLLEKSLERGWTAVVQSNDKDRQKKIDDHLWTYKPEGFLPHGLVEDDHAKDVPIFLTVQDQTRPNGAEIRFLIDCGSPDDWAGYERLVYLFDGADEKSVERARALWKQMKETENFELTYWQQNHQGRWEKKG